jgi:hypothetical protein
MHSAEVDELSCTTSIMRAYPLRSAVLDSVLIDDASPVIAYSGFAPISSSATPINGPSIATTPQDYGGTLSTTSTPDASASVTFSGEYHTFLINKFPSSRRLAETDLQVQAPRS